MATYNGEDFIGEQIESILSQTYKHIELIICDDGSSDGTITIINHYRKQYPFIKLYHNDRRLGFVKNFEKAIGLCNGEYIALSDQDDIWDNKKLEIQLLAIVKEEAQSSNIPLMVHSDLRIIDENSEIIGSSYFRYKQYKLKTTKDLGHIAGPCGVMGNTILFNQHLKYQILPFPKEIEYHDYWLALMNELFGKRITLRQPLVNYRIHTSNTSNTKNSISTITLNWRMVSASISGNLTPPFLDSKRSDIFNYIFKNFAIKPKDREMLLYFQEYLTQKNRKIKHLYTLFRYEFLKRDFSYRLAFVINYIFFKRK